MNPLKDLVPTGTVWMPPRIWDGVKWDVYTCRFDEYKVSFDLSNGEVYVRKGPLRLAYIVGQDWTAQQVVDTYRKMMGLVDTVKEFEDE